MGSRFILTMQDILYYSCTIEPVMGGNLSEYGLRKETKMVATKSWNLWLGQYVNSWLLEVGDDQLGVGSYPHKGRKY